MTPDKLTSTLNELGIADLVTAAMTSATVQALTDDPVTGPARSNPEMLARLAYVFEREAIAALDIQTMGGEDAKKNFTSAFACWVSFARLQSSWAPNAQSTELTRLADELIVDRLPIGLNVAFHIGISGIFAEQIPETRLDLERFPLAALVAASSAP